LKFYEILFDSENIKAILACFVQSFLRNRKWRCKKLVEFKEVKRANIVFGEYNVIARMSTDNLEKLEEFVSENIRKVPNFIVTSTIIISKEYKKDDRPKSKYPLFS
jgi:DNA-binding Lrp family transcriptional regulator